MSPTSVSEIIRKSDWSFSSALYVFFSPKSALGPGGAHRGWRWLELMVGVARLWGQTPEMVAYTCPSSICASMENQITWHRPEEKVSLMH